MKNVAVSDALKEVWKIKEEIYEEDKNCSLLESLNRAHRIAEKIIKERRWRNYQIS